MPLDLFRFRRPTAHRAGLCLSPAAGAGSGRCLRIQDLHLSANSGEVAKTRGSPTRCGDCIRRGAKRAERGIEHIKNIGKPGRRSKSLREPAYSWGFWSPKERIRLRTCRCTTYLVDLTTLEAAMRYVLDNDSLNALISGELTAHARCVVLVPDTPCGAGGILSIR